MNARKERNNQCVCLTIASPSRANACTFALQTVQVGRSSGPDRLLKPPITTTKQLPRCCEAVWAQRAWRRMNPVRFSSWLADAGAQPSLTVATLKDWLQFSVAELAALHAVTRFCKATFAHFLWNWSGCHNHTCETIDLTAIPVCLFVFVCKSGVFERWTVITQRTLHQYSSWQRKSSKASEDWSTLTEKKSISRISVSNWEDSKRALWLLSRW